MEKPHSGTWVGTVVLERAAKAVQLVLELRFEDDGTVSGRFTVYPGETRWTGPREGTLSRGSFSPFGVVHLEGTDDKRHISLDARYEFGSEAASVLWGTLLVVDDEVSETGTLAAVLTPESLQTARKNVW